MSNPFSKETEFSVDLFVERTRELCGTLDRLANPQSRVSSAVYGDAGIGKSWFLERIKHSYTHIFAKAAGEEPLIFEWQGEGPEFIIMSLDCEQSSFWTPENFWQAIWQQFQAKGSPSSEQEIINELLNTRASDNMLIGQLLDQIARNGRFLVLLLDNFDRIIEQMDPYDPSFLDKIRSLLVRELKGLGIVLVTSKLLHDLCISIHFDDSPFDNVFYPVELKPFDKAEAYEFIRVRLKETDVHFSDEEKQDLFRVSQGNPDRLREDCYSLFEAKSR